MSETVVAQINGELLPIDSLPTTYTYSGTYVQTSTVTYRNITYIETYTYAGENVVGYSGWIPQLSREQVDALGFELTSEQLRSVGIKEND